MNKQEIWMSVKDYVGLYEVSNYGDVRNARTGRVLKLIKKNTGYFVVNLSKNGKCNFFRVHRLVYEAFAGDIPEGMVIDHCDGNPQNNCIDNLRCVTPYENVHNSVTFHKYLDAIDRRTKDKKWRKNVSEANRRKAGDPEWQRKHAEAVRKACNKPVLQIDCNTGQVIREWDCMTGVERNLGISHANISACCCGKIKSAGGYIWKYA